MIGGGLFRPTSFAWLFAHEARLLWRGSILVRTRRHVLVPMIAVGLVFQAVALAIALLAAHSRLSAATLVMIANLNIIFLLALMLSRAMTSAIDVLFTRGDGDFLLASPIPPARVLAVRMLGTAAATASPWLLLGGVLANALTLFGHARALAVYPMIFGLAMVASAAAFALVVLLVGRFGAEKARTMAHFSALLVGLGIFALGQTPRFVPAATMGRFWRGFMPSAATAHSALWLPGRAMLGQAGPLVASLGACLIVFLLVLFTLDQKFATGAISAAAMTGGKVRRAGGGHFRDNAMAAAMLKNLRLLLRFPGLATQTVYRSLTLVPVAMILTGRVAVGAGPQIVAPLVVFLAGQLALFFASVIIGSEQAPDLLAAAPTGPRLGRNANFAAAGYATLLLMALPIMGILLREPNILAVVIAGVTGAAFSNLALAQTHPIQLMRAAFGKNRVGSTFGLALGVAVSSAWALGAYVAVTPQPFAFLHPV